MEGRKDLTRTKEKKRSKIKNMVRKYSYVGRWMLRARTIKTKKTYFILFFFFNKVRQRDRKENLSQIVYTNQYTHTLSYQKQRKRAKVKSLRVKCFSSRSDHAETHIISRSHLASYAAYKPFLPSFTQDWLNHLDLSSWYLSLFLFHNHSQTMRGSAVAPPYSKHGAQ